MNIYKYIKTTKCVLCGYYIYFFLILQALLSWNLKNGFGDRKTATPPELVLYSPLNPSPENSETFVIEFCGRNMSEYVIRQHKYSASDVRVVIRVKGFVLSPPPTCTAMRR